MSITSLQVCMDSSDWLQGTISEEGPGMDTSPIISPTGDEMLTCSRPILERRLRPNHEQALKCPRCESTHTKFCYYNNYSLSQPRYFCKTCRRYWTKGGTLRNIPVGGGCRRNNKKVTSKKSAAAADHHNNHSPTSSSPLIMLNQSNCDNNLNPNPNPTDLQLAFTDQLQFQSLHAGLYAHGVMLENPAPIDFMENKYEALLGEHDGYNYGGIMPNAASYGGIWSSSLENPGILESCQRLMLPYDNHHRVDQNDGVLEMKPNNKVLSLEWHDQQQQACNSDAGGYNFSGLGSWTGLMNGYGSSTMNPLV